MTYEAELVEWGETPSDFIVDDGTGIEKGTLLKASDPRTAAASDGQADMLAGIAYREKVASDGRIRLAVLKKCIARLYCSGTISTGKAVMSAGAVNKIMQATTTVSGLQILGVALEDGTDNTQIQVAVNVGAGKA